MKIIASLLLLFLATGTIAQNKASIKGLLADSATKAPLEHATIAVVNAKDTSLVSYTLSDKNGGFHISGIPTDRTTKLIISYIGYQTYRKILELNKGETKDLGTLFFSGNNLHEVIIKGERSPIVTKKDTVEFNIEAFKTRPNAVVEELLRKLPGVQVNNDGSILVNGKSINKLLIDGKQFFGKDPKVATRNLEADMIDKIQVYDDRENDPDHKLTESEVGKIINLKLKSKIKKSTLGKFYAGGGSRDRYEAAGILSSFRDTLQISLIGLTNNLSKTGFSQDDLYSMGGFNRSEGSQIWDGTFGGRGWGGLENVTSGGFNLNNDYGTKLKMNLTYFYTNTGRINSSNGINEQTLGDTILSSNSSYNSKSGENKHAIGGLIEWNPDSLNKVRYEPSINFERNNSSSNSNSNSRNNFVPRLNDNIGDDRNQSNGTNFSHNLSYYRRLNKKGKSLNIQHSLNLNENKTTGYSYNAITSYDSSFPSTIQDRLADQQTINNSGNISLNYNQPISKKLSAELSSDTRYSTSREDLLTYDKNIPANSYDLFLPDQSSALNRRTMFQSIKPQLNYQIGKRYSVRMGLSMEFQDVTNHFNSTVKDRRQHYNFFPALQFSGPGFSINFSERLEQPQIYQMQPIERVYSPLYKSVGNPNLKAGRDYQFSGNLYKYIHTKQLNMNAYASVNLTENNVIQRNLIEGNGASTNTYINSKNAIRGYMSGSIGKQFKKSQNWQMGLNTSFNVSARKSEFFLNADAGDQYNYNYGVDQSVNFNYNELLSINTNYRFSNSLTEYKKVKFRAISTYTHTLGTDFSLRWPKKVILDAKYNFNYNPQVAQGFPRSSHIVNLALTLQMLKKDRGQLKISVYDLLDQNISVYRYAQENSVSTSDDQILKRYFLLTYQYKINIYKAK